MLNGFVLKCYFSKNFFILYSFWIVSPNKGLQLKRKRLSLEEAIRKMTHFPAQTIGIPKRGLIKVGYFADLLVFEPKNLKANATYENPHELATGFDHVFVNGKLVMEKDQFKLDKQKSVGRILKP